MILEGKTVLITGGTGSLGKKLVRRIMSGEVGKPKKVIIFSRDEDKQHSMKLELANVKIATDDLDYHFVDQAINFRIGDVKDYESLIDSVKEANIIVHAAALKQVPTCEYFPFESVKTNIIGTHNVIRAVKEFGENVEVVLLISTDKACKSVSTYGMCKAIQERMMVQANIDDQKTRYICVRYGNVIASRGSVMPLFIEQIRSGGPVTITAREMTRFWLTLDTAVNIIFDALGLAQPGEILVPNLPSANVLDLVDTMIANKKISKVFTGVRPGEKIHEILISEEETNRTIKRDNYYAICPILTEFQRKPIDPHCLTAEYSSADHIMTKDELKDFLGKEGLIGFEDEK